SAPKPEASPVVPKEPPEPIDELPPDQKPEGDNVQWIPGYWAWDDQASDFLWISGFWRDVPPGRRWVPGTWQKVEGGWQWVAGFWDHPLHERGLLFAPVRIDRTVLARRWTYVPSYCVQSDFLLTALFVRPSHQHYYFGDYFERSYVKSGFVPWVDYRYARTVS